MDHYQPGISSIWSKKIIFIFEMNISRSKSEFLSENGLRKSQNGHNQHRNRTNGVKLLHCTPYLKPSSILAKDNLPIRPRIRNRLAIRIGATKSPEKYARWILENFQHKLTPWSPNGFWKSIVFFWANFFCEMNFFPIFTFRH